MNRKCFVPLCLTAVVGLLVYIITLLTPTRNAGIILQLMLVGICAVSVYLVGNMASKRWGDTVSWIMRATTLVLFALYISVLLNFTLFEPVFGRSGTGNWIFADATLAREYISESFNIVPFKTISLFVHSIGEHTLSLSAVVTNLVGNLLALMPMAFFLPLSVKSAKRWLPFLLYTAGVIVCIELLQLVFMTGSCDIDDLLLNLSGAAAAYAILRLNYVRKITDKLNLKG